MMAVGSPREAAERPPALAADFVISAAAAHQFPEPLWPEIALLGRSNAGKSSLLNRWLGRKGLAKVGAIPGRTRLINFFQVTWNKTDQPFMLADLPGYGFAAAPKAMVKGWRQLVADYLEAGRPLKMALLLMDIRREPCEDEFGLLEWLCSLNIPARVIATKADKLKGGERAKQLAELKKIFENRCGEKSGLLLQPPLAFSSTTALGRHALIEALIDSGLLTSGLDTDSQF